METGQYIQDGTVKWIVTDIRDGDMVGDITFHPTLLPGHIKANRANWTDASMEIPRLLAWVQANNMLTTDVTDESKYLYDSETDVLTLPNVMDRIIQGGNAVESKQAGLPNIAGYFQAPYAGGGDPSLFGGAFSSNVFNFRFVNGGSSGVIGGRADFDASLSSSIYGNSQTVQPPAIVMIPQIKY